MAGSNIKKKKKVLDCYRSFDSLFDTFSGVAESIVPRECKQAVFSIQEGKQAIKSKEGAIKCMVNTYP